MRNAFLFVFVMLSAGMALAQEDIITRPTASTAPWMAAAAPSGTPAEQLCLFACGADFLDPVNHLVCAPLAMVTPSDGQTVPGSEGEVTSPVGEGDACYRVIALSQSGVVSEPSDNTLTVLDLPMRPMFVR